MITLSIIIVSYNTKELTLDCLHSIYDKSKDISLEIIVVDNASSDGTVDAIKKQFPLVTLLISPENLGFAAANNNGFLHATGKFFLLLNSDTLLIGNVLKDSIDFISKNPELGVLGCRAMLLNGKQQITIFRDLSLSNLFINIFVPSSVQRRSKLLGKSRYVGIDLNKSHEVDVVAGCFMLVRREVIDQVGALDADFFFYGEEAEWCYRIRKHGWKVMYFPGAKILHYGGGSTTNISSKKAILMAQGQLLYLKKTKGEMVAYMGNLLMIARDIPRVLLWNLLRFIPNFNDKKITSFLSPSIARFPFQLRYLLPGATSFEIKIGKKEPIGQ